MIPPVRVPANFGRELINSPVHGNLVLNLRDGSVLRVNSIIMSLNSPVIGNMTTNLCQSSIEMDDFSVEAVHCFVDAMYCGESEMLERVNFEDVNKMAHVFGVGWFRKKCLKFFKTHVLNFENNSYEEILFACEIASRANFNLKQSKFVGLFVRNMNSRNIGKRVFLRKYMSDLAGLSKRQINMAIQIAGRELNILFDCLISYLTFGLKYTGFDENSLYLLEQVDMSLFQQRYPDQFVEVVDLITELSGGSESGKVKELLEKVVKLRSEGVAGGSNEVLEDSQCSEGSEDSNDEDVQEGCRHVAIQTDEVNSGQIARQTDEIKTGWIQPVIGTLYPLLPDEPVQFITTDNEKQEYIGVGYTVPVEGSTDRRWFNMRCENINTSQWNYLIGGCTVYKYNTQYLNSVPPDKVKHWIITKTCTHLKVVCNNVTVLNFNFATDYSPGNETSHQVWLNKCTDVDFIPYYQNLLFLKPVG
ncbi:uncharacterized protein LOC134822567 isoform X1 [Bolinopsis microptera]|uniref:uncharacterized protein LOC134822567 isoform X1 n=1 Tax=Bolinopsis microptera TaxID=2820187 RepID=UPI00307AB532